MTSSCKGSLRKFFTDAVGAVADKILPMPAAGPENIIIIPPISVIMAYNGKRRPAPPSK